MHDINKTLNGVPQGPLLYPLITFWLINLETPKAKNSQTISPIESVKLCILVTILKPKIGSTQGSMAGPPIVYNSTLIPEERIRSFQQQSHQNEALNSEQHSYNIRVFHSGHHRPSPPYIQTLFYQTPQWSLGSTTI